MDGCAPSVIRGVSLLVIAVALVKLLVSIADAFIIESGNVCMVQLVIRPYGSLLPLNMIYK